MGFLIARVTALENLVNRLLARIDALEQRLAASEQSLTQRWNSQ